MQRYMPGMPLGMRRRTDTGRPKGNYLRWMGDGLRRRFQPAYENIQENAKSINREKQYVAYKKSGGGRHLNNFAEPRISILRVWKF